MTASPLRPGPRNCITDVEGIAVGQAEAPALLTGVTTIVPDAPAVAAASVAGGAPGTRGTTILEPASVATKVDAVVLSGGSAYGLDAPGGAMDRLRAEGRGFAIGPVRVPIVPGAIIFDLLTGGPKDWDTPPWWRLGQEAVSAAGGPVALGNAGAGMGARAGPVKGGTGTASFTTEGFTVGALAVVNAIGAVTIPGSRAFWAGPFEQDGEFGALPPPNAPASLDFDFSPFSAGANTTLAVVATDLALTREEAARVAVMAHDGFARAIRPVHSPLDGDTVFVLSTGAQPMRDPVPEVSRLGMLAGDCVARAIARGVYEAEALGGCPAWRDMGDDGTLPG